MSDTHSRPVEQVRAAVQRAREQFMTLPQFEPRSEDDHPRTAVAGAGLGRYFEPDGLKAGVEHYRLRDSGYPVWTIIGALRAAEGDVHAVAGAHAIAEARVHACIGMLLHHPLPILGRITDEEDPEVVSAEAG